MSADTLTRSSITLTRPRLLIAKKTKTTNSLMDFLDYSFSYIVFFYSVVAQTTALKEKKEKRNVQRVKVSHQ